MVLAPVRPLLNRWRFALLAALLLLAGAMGGTALGRPSAGPDGAATGCPNQGGCDSHLTAPSPPALLQAALRIDGKAMAGGDAGTALPASHGLSPIHADIALAGRRMADGPAPRGDGRHPGQPRGPPARD